MSDQTVGGYKKYASEKMFNNKRVKLSNSFHIQVNQFSMETNNNKINTFLYLKYKQIFSFWSNEMKLIQNQRYLTPKFFTFALVYLSQNPERL